MRENNVVHRHSWPTRQELVSEVFEYIEAFYNRRRRHFTLGLFRTVDDEDRHAALARRVKSE